MTLGEEDFNFETFDEQFEAEYEAEDEEAVEGEEETFSDESDDSVEEEELTDEEAEEVPPSRTEDQSKHDTAFAQLRRERDEARQLASWIAQMAEENGTTPEEMRQRYEEARMSEQAEKSGVPVEFLQRQTQTERELQELKSQHFATQFNASVEATMAKYDATPQDIEQTFAYAQNEGLVQAVQTGAISFDALHRLAHLETFTEKRVQTALQESLSQKKKRQSEAPIGNGSAAADSEIDYDALAEADAKKALLDW